VGHARSSSASRHGPARGLLADGQARRRADICATLAPLNPAKRTAWILVGLGVVLLNVGQRWRPLPAEGASGDLLAAAFLLLSVGGGLACLLVGGVRLWRMRRQA